MYQVSQAYKESMKRPTRERSYMKVMLGLINQEAQNSVVLENQSQYIDYSNPTIIFEKNWIDKSYATYEQDFFKADGSMLFRPRNSTNYIKNKIVSQNLFSETFIIKFSFGYGETDIKGLTIQFGENYPTSFTVTTDDGTETVFTNESPYFETGETFFNTSSIALTIHSMLVPNGRVMIEYVKFGIGLEYDNDWIIKTESTSTLSGINEDLPESSFSVTLNNMDQIFNVDNPDSAINFLEPGQQINVIYGYELDDGSIEWMQLHTMNVYEWSSDDSQATIQAVDRLRLMSDLFYKGQYYENGISLYNLAETVLEDAGIEEDEYYIDSYLKNVLVKNPLPRVMHKEALQIIANAGRCILNVDRYGKISIHSAFIPDYETTSNGTTYFSDVKNVDTNEAKKLFATYEMDYWRANGGMLFLPKEGEADCGYVSAQISDSSGLFSENPIITRAFEAHYKSYGIMIKFRENLPAKFVIRTYSDNILAEELEISDEILADYELYHEFPEFNKMEIEFVETSVPNSRVKIDYISIGEETDYQIRYDDLYSTPQGTQLDKVKVLKVVRTILSKTTTFDELVTDKITYDGENQIYYFDDPCYGYAASITDDLGTASVVSSGSYYVEVQISGVNIGSEIEIKIQGYKYNVSKSNYEEQISNGGTNKEWENPLISDYDLCAKVSEWVADYFAAQVEYELDYRGEPALDAGDTIFQENKYNPQLKTIIEEIQLLFEKSISGALRTRRKENVVRT